MSEEEAPPVLKEGSVTPPQVNRRGFIRLAAGTVAAGTIGGVGLKLFSHFSSAKREISSVVHSSSAARSEAIKKPEETEVLLLQQRGVVVYGAGSNHMPIRYQDAVGTTGLFDQNLLTTEQGRAKAQDQMRVAEVRRVTTTKPLENLKASAVIPKKEKPIIRELPPGVLTKEQLGERGIEIIDSDEYGFYLREGAFDVGELLESFQIGGKEKLVIGITDSPVIAKEYFADPRYNSIRSEIDRLHSVNPKELRANKIRDLEQQVNDPRFEARRLELEAKIKALETLTDEEIKNWGLDTGATDGFALRAEEVRLIPDTNIVLLAFGSYPVESLDFLEVTVSPSSEPSTLISFFGLDLKNEWGLRVNRRFNPNDSFPNPDEFRDTGEHGKLSPAYRAEDRTVGLTVRHELSHIWRWKHINADPSVQGNESETDRTAMASIARASEKRESAEKRGDYIVIRRKSDGVIMQT